MGHPEAPGAPQPPPSAREGCGDDASNETSTYAGASCSLRGCTSFVCRRHGGGGTHGVVRDPAQARQLTHAGAEIATVMINVDLEHDGIDPTACVERARVDRVSCGIDWGGRKFCLVYSDRSDHRVRVRRWPIRVSCKRLRSPG